MYSFCELSVTMCNVSGLSMSACKDVLSRAFPNIDHEISDYVNGLLEDCDDFESAEDLFDAVGLMLLQADGGKSEDDIKAICKRLHSVLNFGLNNKIVSENEENNHNRTLDAPVHMGSMVYEYEKHSDANNSIWLKRRDNDSKVDKKKLEKAEAQRQKKLDRRLDAPPEIKIPDSLLATASQQINRKDAKLDASGTNRNYDIRIEDFDVAFGERVLLSGASIYLMAGRRYGFIGRNGLGKTTLLKMIAGGQLKIPSHITVLHVEQEVTGDDTLALQSVLECDTKREGLLKEEKDIVAKLNSSSPGSDKDISTRLHEVYKELEEMEAEKAPARASVILNGLGFSSEGQSRPTREFSGGWRMRLALARALFSKPDLLLLDEPTNMLDMKAIIWLENYLQKWPTTILVVSHDRLFLNAVSTDILHLNSQIIDTYRGNYEAFHRTRSERLKNQQREYEAQKQYRDHIQIFIDRFRYNANRASQVQSKLKLLEKLPPLKPVEKESESVIKFPQCEKLSPPILQLDEVYFYYTKSNPIFCNICVNASMESRICIVGENGAGKTTLLKILLGDLNPVSGIRHGHRSLRIGYFSQHHVDQLDMNANSVELLAHRFPGKTSEMYRGQLGYYGVSGELALRPVSSLSGGQKSRVAFAVMSMTNPNFFILDEPTNHLDMETIEALGEALNKFQGGVVLVSHDERLIRKVCNELWVVANKTVVSLEGGFDEYKMIVEAEMQEKGI